jgi:DNA-binding IclR family transcriptional regulator
METVKKAFQLLEAVTLSPVPKSATELSQELGINRSSVSRMLALLAEMGYLYQGKDRKYVPDLRLLEMAGRLLHKMELIRTAVPYLVDLLKKVGFRVYLTVVWRGKTIILYQAHEYDNPILGLEIGFGAPVYASSNGKAILAFQNENQLRKVFREIEFRKLTANTITDPEQLLEYLGEVRRQGFAVNNQENSEDRSVAAPIRNYRGEVIASVSIGGRYSLDEVERMAREVISTAQKISFGLGYNAVSLREGFTPLDYRTISPKRMNPNDASRKNDGGSRRREA